MRAHATRGRWQPCSDHPSWQALAEQPCHTDTTWRTHLVGFVRVLRVKGVALRGRTPRMGSPGARLLAHPGLPRGRRRPSPPVQGPFASATMLDWFTQRQLRPDVRVLGCVLPRAELDVWMTSEPSWRRTSWFLELGSLLALVSSPPAGQGRKYAPMRAVSGGARRSRRRVRGAHVHACVRAV